MFSLRRQTREHKGATPLYKHIGLLGYVDDHVILTAGGDVAIVLGVRAPDYECAMPEALNEASGRFEKALGLLKDGFRFTQYFFRTKRSDGYYHNQTFFVVTRHSKGLPMGVQIGRRRPLTLAIRKALAGVRKENMEVGANFQAVSGLDCWLMNQAESYAALRQFTNFSAESLSYRLNGPEFLDYQLGDVDIERYSSPAHLKMVDDARYLRVLTLKELSQTTWPMMWGRMAAAKAEFFCCLDWRSLSPERSLLLVNQYRNMIGAKPKLKSGEQAKKEDEGAAYHVEELGKVGQRSIAKGSFLGEMAVTVVCHGSSVAEAQAYESEVSSLFRVTGSKLRPESGLGGRFMLQSYLAALPGNHAYQQRTMKVFPSNLADCSFWFGQAEGSAVNEQLRAPCALTVRTNQDTPYHLNLHVGEVGHSVILGKIGSGKSFTLNVLIQALEKYNPFTIVLDKGGVFHRLCQERGGSYFELSGRQMDRGWNGFKINPFACQRTDRNLHFLSLFVSVLLEQSGEKLTGAEKDKVYDRVEALFSCSGERTLGVLARCLLPPSLGSRLKKWTRPGQYGWIFDNPEDGLALTNFQAFELSGMDDYADLMEALLLYVLHRTDETILDPSNPGLLKCLFIDEAWLFLKNDAIREYLEEALLTWRKHNGMVVLATQEADALLRSSLADTVASCCATKLMLHSPGLNREKYAQYFKLTEAEMDAIEGSQPKKQFVLCQEGLVKPLTLEVEDRTFWLAVNDKNSNAKIAEYKELYGSEWLVEILKEGRNGHGSARGPNGRHLSETCDVPVDVGDRVHHSSNRHELVSHLERGEV